jgi:hypothetical protein
LGGNDCRKPLRFKWAEWRRRMKIAKLTWLLVAWRVEDWLSPLQNASPLKGIFWISLGATVARGQGKLRLEDLYYSKSRKSFIYKPIWEGEETHGLGTRSNFQSALETQATWADISLEPLGFFRLREMQVCKVSFQLIIWLVESREI